MTPSRGTDTPLRAWTVSQCDSVLTVGAEHADVPSHSAESVDRQPADAPESSPSSGAEEVADDMHAVYGLGDREPRATIESDEYLKDFFGVSS